MQHICDILLTAGTGVAAYSRLLWRYTAHSTAGKGEPSKPSINRCKLFGYATLRFHFVYGDIMKCELAERRIHQSLQTMVSCFPDIAQTT